MWGPEPATLRRLYVYVSGLPLNSAFGRSLGVREQWGNVEELLAVLVEHVDFGNRILYAVNSKRGSKQPKAVKVPRPSGKHGETEDVPKKKRPATSEELVAFFGGAVRFTGESKKGRSSAEGT